MKSTLQRGPRDLPAVTQVAGWWGVGIWVLERDSHQLTYNKLEQDFHTSKISTIIISQKKIRMGTRLSFRVS